MIIDENVERVRKVREKLVAKHGGLQGWIRHLQELERQKKRRKRPGRRKGSK